MARASIPTLLSLDRYARIMGLNPLHFAGASCPAHGSVPEYFPLRNRCSDLWCQHSWQYADGVCREDLAAEIDRAEHDLARELGWWPAPKWIAEEVAQMPRFHRREWWRDYARNVRGARVSVRAQYGKVVGPGRRATSPVGEASVANGRLVYSDADGDGFVERAQVTMATSVADANELHVFFPTTPACYPGDPADESWQMRTPHYKALSGGTLTVRFWTWQMIDPDLWEFLPTTETEAGELAINLVGLSSTPADTSRLVQSVNVYRVYNDTAATSATFFWEATPSDTGLTFCADASGCQACTYVEQDGCLQVRDARLGFVVPAPATYDADAGEWSASCFSKERDPDFVKLWYYAGDLANRHLRDASPEPLSERWARAIAYMATARLERPFCSCGNVLALCHKMQEDLALSEGGRSYQNEPALVLDNPFGTRRGEVLAWREVRQEPQRVRGGGAI